MPKTAPGPEPGSGASRWRHAVEAAGLGLWDWDCVAGRVHYTREWKRLFGYGDADIGSSADERSGRIHPEDFARCAAELQRQLEGRSPAFAAEYRMRCADGRYKWVIDRGRVVVRDDEGMALRFVGVVADIDAAKTLEADLRDSQRRYRAVFDSMFQLMGVLLPDGTAIDVNGAALRFAGLEREDVLGCKMWETQFFQTSAQTRELARLAVQRAAQGELVRTELEILGAGDRTMAVDFSIKPAYDEAGRIVMLVPEGRDVTERRLAEQAVRESAERFRRTFADAPIGMAMVSPDGRFLEVNDALCIILGRDRDEVLAISFQDITHPEDLDADLALVRQVLAGEIPRYRMNKRYLARDGHAIHVQLDVSLLRGAHGEPLHFISQIQDISERLHFQALLFAEKERFQVALAAITDAVLITGVEGVVDFLNPVAERLLGRAPRDAAGRHVADLVDLREDDPQRPARILRAITEQHASFVQGTGHLHRPGAPPITVEYAVAPLKDAGGALMGYAVTLHDVTQARALTRALEHQATHDALTGLLNRSGFERILEQQRLAAVATERPWCLLYLDLDRFKTVNDTAGHAVGDELLRAIAIRLRSVLRATDIFARLGGDEFGIILDDCPAEDAERIATKLIDTVDRFRFRRGEAQFQLGLSIGVARGASGEGTAADLLRMADTACYVAKRTGRNRSCTYDDRAIAGVSASAEFDSLHELQRAIDEDRLRVHAQKIVDVKTGAAVGAELLLRMAMPDGTLVAPDRFLAIAERHDIITKLDGWMLTRAARLVSGVDGRLPERWFVTVNVSGLSISDPRFHRVISETINGDQVLRDRICFEITESAAPSNWSVTRQGIELLRSHGSRVLLDDFGSGFTSFEYLRNLRVDGLKIAQDFTCNMDSDPINEPVVSLVAELTQRFNICAIAEGIENAAAWRMVADKRIGMAQGFHFHRPEPVENLLTRG